MSNLQRPSSVRVRASLRRLLQMTSAPNFSPLSRIRRPTTFRAMNVFVTGGAGYIGSICTEELPNAGHAGTGVDDLSQGHRSAVDSRAKFVPGKPDEQDDILKAVRAAKPEAII